MTSNKSKYIFRKWIIKPKDETRFYTLKKEYMNRLWKKHTVNEAKYYLFVTIIVSLILFTVFSNEIILDVIAIIDLFILISLIKITSEKGIEKLVRKEFDKKYGEGKYDELNLTPKN